LLRGALSFELDALMTPDLLFTLHLRSSTCNPSFTYSYMSTSVPLNRTPRVRTPLTPAHKFGVSTYQLALVNDAVISENCDNLEPGQTVCLGIEGHDCTKVYTVNANE
jgi:hypothetical protein